VSTGIILPIATQETIFENISVTSDFSFFSLVAEKLTSFGGIN
jgi:hypothetical protein